MKSLSLFFVFSIFSMFCLDAAVSSYSKGYIVSNKNDTIYGLLKFESNLSSAQKCILKDSTNQDEHVYSPDDISLYRYSNGKYYVSKSLTINEGTKKVFMEYLVKGIVDVYYYSDNSDGRYFIDKGDGILIELKNTKYIVKEDDKTFQRNKNEYINILAQIFQESPKTCEELMRSELDYKSLIKLVVDYHKDLCNSDQCVVYMKKTNKEKLHAGLLFGLSTVSLTKGKINDDEECFRGIQLSSTIYPSIGCFFELKLPYINNDLLFARYEASFYHESVKGSTSFQTDNSTISNYVKDTKSNFRNTLLIRYDLSRNKFCPFIETGIFAKLAIHSTFERTRSVQQNNSSNVNSVSYTGNSPFLKTEVGPVGGLGLRYKLNTKHDLFLSMRYAWGTGIISDQHFKSNLFSLNLGLQLF